NRTQAVKWRDVDWVVWVDYGFSRTLWQAVRRAAVRAWHQTELWPDTGNCESFRCSFFSRESIILWTIKTYRKNRIKYLADQQDPANRHIRFIQLRSPAETAAFLASLC
ncbi:MAG: adenylate kinase, partial [Shewanella oncorhynchi]